MGKIIQFYNHNSVNITKGDNMYREFLRTIHEKPKTLRDMPDRAQEVLDYFQIKKLSHGVPIVEILKKMGFKIFQSELEPNGLSAYIAVDPKLEVIYGSNKITCVHIKDNIGHKRFALAHELGHYLFDFNQKENIYYYDTYFPEKDSDKNDIKEKRADLFAASLLMPQKEFKQKLKEYKELQIKVDIVSALGKYFVVSPTAILKRFEELKIPEFENRI